MSHNSDPTGGPPQVSGEVAANFIQAQLNGWDFVTERSEDNIFFTYNVCRWVMEAFGRKLFDDKNKSCWAEYGGEDIPGSLRPLITQTVPSKTPILTGENRISMVSTPEADYTEPYIPKWETLGKVTPFEEMLKIAAGDPDIYERVKPQTIRVYDSVGVTFQPPAYSYGWGIDFNVRPHEIEMASIGERGKAWPAARYVESYRDRHRIVAATVAELAALTAQKNIMNVHTVPQHLLTSFDRWLDREGKPPVPEVRPDRTSPIKELLVSSLAEMGLVNLEGEEL